MCRQLNKLIFIRSDYIRQINGLIERLKTNDFVQNAEKLDINIYEILENIPNDLNIVKVTNLRKIKEELSIIINKVYYNELITDSNKHRNYKKWGCVTNIKYSYRQIGFLSRAEKCNKTKIPTLSL